MIILRCPFISNKGEHSLVGVLHANWRISSQTVSSIFPEKDKTKLVVLKEKKNQIEIKANTIV